MTYTEVKQQGAEIIRYAPVMIPTSGWEEISAERVREIYNEAKTRAISAGNATEHSRAVMLRDVAEIALKRFATGGRVFAGFLQNGEMILAASGRNN